MSTLAAGTVVDGFTIRRVLGTGGMATVYEAQDERFGRRVALKLASRELAQDPRFVDRFHREARALAAVAHPNVARAHGSGVYLGVPYIALELLSAGTLDDRIKREGRLAWREAARVGAEIARGLAAIHEVGLVHRDLKPANVLLDDQGTAKVSDLGLARGQALGGALTRSHELLGTLEYMAPEQAESSNVGPSADLYALGATLYALLAGEPPFRGSGAELVKKHALDVPPPITGHVRELPASLAALVHTLLAKDPHGRPGSAAEVAARLEAIAREPDAQPRGASRAWVAVLASVLGAVVGGAAVALVVIGRNAPAPPPPAPPPPAPKAPPAIPVATPPPPAPAPAPVARALVVSERWAKPHGSEVFSIAFMPDGKRFATGGFGTVKLWDVETGIELFTLEGHAPGTKVMSLVFAHDGKTLYSGGEDKTLRSWDLASRTGTIFPDAHNHFVSALGLSPDGKRLASGGYDLSVSVWNVAARTVEARYAFDPTPDHESVSCVAFSPDGRRLVAACLKRIAVLDAPSWSFVRLFTMTDTITKLEFVAARPSFVVYGNWSGSPLTSGVGRLNLDRADREPEVLWKHVHGAPAFCLVRPNVAVAGGFDGTLHLLDRLDGEPQVVPVAAHGEYETCHAAASRDGSHFAVSGASGTVRLYSVVR